MADDKKDFPSGSENKEDKKQEGQEEGGSSKTKKETEAPLNLPEKLKGKSAEEITKMYLEAEKKIGEQSTSVSEAKKLKEQTDVMLRAIWSDPDLYRQVESGINKYVSGEGLPDTRKKTKPIEKGDEEAKGTAMSPEVADIRKATENRILSEFRQGFGYNDLKPKDSQEKFTKTAQVLAEILDPSGKKSVKEIVAGISLDKLPKYLRYAHRIAHSADAAEQAKRSALVSVEENRAASIGSFSASSGKSEGKIQLTERERKTASAMGISEEDYAKSKAEIEQDRKKYE